MKFVYLILMLVNLTLHAQVIGEQRGLYVNRFITLVASGQMQMQLINRYKTQKGLKLICNSLYKAR